MTCPSCGEPVADGVAICPKCEAIVDPSMFDNQPAEADGPPEPKGKVVRAASGAKRPIAKRPVDAAGMPVPRRTRAVKPAVKRDRPGGQGMPEAPGRKIKQAPVARPDWRAKDEPSVSRASRSSASGNQMVDPEDFWGEVKGFVGDLSLADKLAFIGALSTLIACFLPWKDTITDGEVLGLLSLGAAVFVATVVILLAIVIRVRKLMPALHALVPWLIQFGGACFCIVWCLVYIRLALDRTMARSPIGNLEVWVSSPSAGVIIALVMSIVMLAGTLMGLREKQR